MRNSRETGKAQLLEARPTYVASVQGRFLERFDVGLLRKLAAGWEALPGDVDRIGRARAGVADLGLPRFRLRAREDSNLRPAD